MMKAISESPEFVDIHCHLVPGIDDGASSPDEAIQMARMAVEDGIRAIVVTPHQLGSYRANTAAVIRRATQNLRELLRQQCIDLIVVPGADVRIEPDMVPLLSRGEIMTLADRKRHLLLELPHELYFDLRPLVSQLDGLGLQSILSHPERNLGLLAQPEAVIDLVDAGCLMQVTAGSLTGTFGPGAAQMGEWMLKEGLVHFLATDAHGVRARRPRLTPAFELVARLSGMTLAREICCTNPSAVSIGERVASGRRVAKVRPRTFWLGRRRVA